MSSLVVFPLSFLALSPWRKLFSWFHCEAGFACICCTLVFQINEFAVQKKNYEFHQLSRCHNFYLKSWFHFFAERPNNINPCQWELNSSGGVPSIHSFTTRPTDYWFTVIFIHYTKLNLHFKIATKIRHPQGKFICIYYRLSFFVFDRFIYTYTMFLLFYIISFRWTGSIFIKILWN